MISSTLLFCTLLNASSCESIDSLKHSPVKDSAITSISSTQNDSDTKRSYQTSADTQQQKNSVGNTNITPNGSRGDTIIKQLYNISAEPLKQENKKHLLQADPKTEKEIKYRELQKQGEEYRQDESVRVKHK